MNGRVPAAGELVLHIGAPKTGSSTIQRHCCLNSAELRSAGLLYPPHPLDDNGVSGGHGGLFAGPVETVRERLAGHLADARLADCRLLLSAESIFADADAVIAALPTTAFHVICFVRHPVDAIAAHHNQGIKRHGGTQTLEQAAAALVAGRIENRSLSGAVLLDWLRICGRERMTVLPYVEHGRPVDSVAWFRGVLGLPATTDDAPINRGYTPAAAEFRRLVNMLPGPTVAGFDGPLDLSLQEYSNASPSPRPTATDILSPDRLAALEAFYRDDVLRLEGAFGIRLEQRDTRPAAETDTLVDVWRHVARDAALAGQVRAAVATVAADHSARVRLAPLLTLP